MIDMTINGKLNIRTRHIQDGCVLMWVLGRRSPRVGAFFEDFHLGRDGEKKTEYAATIAFALDNHIYKWVLAFMSIQERMQIRRAN